MGKKGDWLSSLKKAFSRSFKEKKRQKNVEEHHPVPDQPIIENDGGSDDSHPFPPPEEVKPIVVVDDPPQNVYSIAAASDATTSILGDATSSLDLGKSREEAAAVTIQTIFRGYLARRAKWGLRGLARLKTVIEGRNVKRQTENTLKCTKNFSHLQSQINFRRIRMSEENQALQKQILRAKEFENMQNGDEWNDSLQSKEEIEAKQ
ncbi:protein IQ-DOMAIN 2-like [Rutidosis leptorrhynchoides]|uniref:protein IQ-DOMAIN 2-like n=1 Tax=Rutidosis leptorrhynchoides TaxID=125765 RepID=UPI003A9A5AAC